MKRVLLTNPIEARFWNYHSENPHIYRAFDKIVQHWISLGHKRGSALLAFMIIRWETPVRASKGYKIDHNFYPYYARLWMSRHPEHKGFFRVARIEGLSERLA